MEALSLGPRARGGSVVIDSTGLGRPALGLFTRGCPLARFRADDPARVPAHSPDVPDYGLLNDLVWSDPSDTALDWEENERGVSFCYGKSVINSFLATHVSWREAQSRGQPRLAEAS
jgi:diadenosine tetraphosphatase ApaH/serine/threonine PP2A family protein phosphatase